MKGISPYGCHKIDIYGMVWVDFFISLATLTSFFMVKPSSLLCRRAKLALMLVLSST